MDEQSVVDRINNIVYTDFQLASDKYSDFDAYEDRYIAEIKIRNKHYDDCLIEYEKYIKNLEHSLGLGVRFIYIVATNKCIFIFNINELTRNLYDFKWGDRTMPKNTHFGEYDNKKTKRVGYININDSVWNCHL